VKREDRRTGNQLLKEGRIYEVKQDRHDEANICELPSSGMFAMSILVKKLPMLRKIFCFHFQFKKVKLLAQVPG